MRLIGEGDALSAERVQVEVGTRKPGLVEIRSGLGPGERVITEGQDKARPGQPVRVLALDDGTRDLTDLTAKGQ
jgi:membrane fusion protein (multidrug efflux system)